MDAISSVARRLGENPLDSRIPTLLEDISRFTDKALLDRRSDLVPLLERAFASPGIPARQITPLAIRLLRLAYALDGAFAGAAVDAAFLGALSTNQLFLACLERDFCSDPAFELFLTRLRRTLLGRSLESPSEAACRIMAALAMQGLANEYVFHETASETRTIARMQRTLDAAADDRELLQRIAELLAVAMYRPLGRGRLGATLAKVPANAIPPVLHEIIQAAIRDPIEERVLKADIPSFGDIADDVSLRVRRQYEEHPYPRWRELRQRRPERLRERLSRLFGTDPLPIADERPQVLVPGCGTGQHPLSLAAAHPECDVLAVDISRASLAVAARMARRYGLSNVRFLQADLLVLPALGRRFDFIDCAGVLHHMADPREGLRTLVQMLNPGGIIRAAVYGSWNRVPITMCRAYLEAQGYRPVRKSMLAARRRLLTDRSLDPLSSPVIATWDFYNLSMFRDLCFHVHERSFKVSEMRPMLDDLRLTLLGIAVGGQAARQKYREAFPGDRQQKAAERWEELERCGRLLGCGGLISVWARNAYPDPEIHR